MIVFNEFNHLYLAVIRTWRAQKNLFLQILLNVTQRDLAIAQLRIFQRTEKKQVPLCLFIVLRLFSRADSRSVVHITIIFPK